MTTIIKGIEQTIEHTVDLGCRAMEWYDNEDGVKEVSERYRNALHSIRRTAFFCGLSGVISQRNVERLQKMTDKGIDEILSAERSRLLRL